MSKWSVKGQGHSLTLVTGQLVFKLASCFSEKKKHTHTHKSNNNKKKTVGLFDTKYLVGAYGSTGMKIYTNGICHMHTHI